jgi:thioredoxin 1
MQELNAKEWDEKVLRSSELTLVEFWAPWCPWCRRLTPLLKEIEEKYKGKIVFTSLNSEDYPDIASQYGVMSLPTMKFFCKGREVGELIGYLPEETLKQEFDRIITRSQECITQSTQV